MPTKIFPRALLSGAFALALVLLLAGCRPPGATALLDGRRYLEAGDVPRAVERLEAAVRLLNTNAHAWNHLGIAYHRGGQWTNAQFAYQRALQMDRDLVEVRLNRGELLLEMGRPSEARAEFAAYSLRRPNSADGFERLAAAELRLRDWTAAETHARKAVQLAPDNPAAWNTLGLALAQRGRSADAADAFERSLRAAPRHPPAILNLAVLRHRALNDRVGALKLYQQYLRLQPRPADADAVAPIVRRLESELAESRTAQVRPAPADPPPVVPERTAPPPAATAEAPGPVPAVSPTVTIAPAPPVAPRPPAPAPARAPEVVSRPPPPPPRPAREERPVVVALPPEPEIRAAAAEAPPPVVSVPRATPAPVPPQPRIAPPEAALPPEPRRRGFLDSINPARLFRREPELGPRITPLPPIVEVEPARPTVVAENREAAPAPGPARPAAVFPRFQYRARFDLAPGDRARAEALLARGNEAMTARRYETAAALFAEAAAADPSWFVAHHSHAAAALDAGRGLEALNAAETAVALQPDSAAARHNFALALRRNGYAPDAAAQLELALAADANDVRAHLALGNIFAEQLRLRDRARFHYQRVLELSPRHPQAQAVRHWLAANPR